jgi:hypothetical protein
LKKILTVAGSAGNFGRRYEKALHFPLLDARRPFYRRGNVCHFGHVIYAPGMGREVRMRKINDRNAHFCIDGIEVMLNFGEYTTEALAMEITLAFHKRGVWTDSECFYDYKTDSFKWRAK